MNKLILLGFLALAARPAAAAPTRFGAFEMVYVTPDGVSSQFSGEAAHSFYTMLAKAHAPQPSPVGDCRQVDGNGLACSEERVGGTLVYRCHLSVDAQGVVDLANPVLCPLPGGMGISN